jgi:hypothetical protein
MVLPGARAATGCQPPRASERTTCSAYANGLNPADPADATRDPDGDGADNAFEFAAGTDPQNAASVLHLRAAGYSAAGHALRFPSVTGKTYRIEFSEDLSTWHQLGANVSGTGGEVERTDAAAFAGQRRYYRVIVLPQAP